MTIVALISTKDGVTTADVGDLETLLTDTGQPCSIDGCTNVATVACHYCEQPLCSSHNIGYYGACLVQFDACAPCVKAKEARVAAHRRYWDEANRLS